MRATLVSRPFLWLVLLTYTLCAAIPGGGLVVCLESDGHVTIEVLGAGCGGCCPGDGAESGERDERADSCPCVDVALVGLDAPQAKTKSLQTPPPVPALLWRGPCEVASATCRSVPAWPGSTRNAPVEHVKSVVLRV